MGILGTIWNDPRRRNLGILAAIALVMVLLAVWSLAHQASLTAPHESSGVFFPGLESRLGDVARIRIQTKKGVVDVVFNPEKTWVLASHDDYPASHDQVRATLIGLATLVALEPKTARRDWLPYIDLVSPGHGGNGKEITLYDDKGNVMGSVITGKSEDIGDPTGGIGLYVRHPGSAQSWLARSVVEIKADPGDWLDKDVMSVDRARIQEADVDPASGPSYIVRRDKPSDENFKLVDMPKGRELAYEGAADVVAAAVVDFSFDDVKPAKNFDFTDLAHSSRVVTRTFDGLTITTNVVQQGQDYWASLSADGTTADAKNEASAINAHALGWAYRLPAYKGQQFMTTLETLLKPQGAAAAAAPPGH